MDKDKINWNEHVTNILNNIKNILKIAGKFFQIVCYKTAQTFS